ncbi:phage tail protein [Natronobiforma cellulositropha]|uniref:phage tail protein n=1 Tax=Natronobiforma cellulositropha TaxID=1679076 RepID=UPI0021D60DDF|nr:phage tail protein [Natronobiforma cellulositropha]
MADLHGPYRGERFVLDLGGKELDGFTEIQIPKHKTEKSHFRAGDDAAHQQQLWSTTSYEDLVITRAVDNDLTLFEWRKKVQQGQLDEAREDSIAVILKDEQGVSALRWEFEDAWPKEYRTPDLDAASHKIATETLVIAHEGMTRK